MPNCKIPTYLLLNFIKVFIFVHQLDTQTFTKVAQNLWPGHTDKSTKQNLFHRNYMRRHISTGVNFTIIFMLAFIDCTTIDCTTLYLTFQANTTWTYAQ